MTPSEIETAAKQKYNATGDSFFTQAEVLNYIYEASLELAREAMMVERTYTTTTTSGTREYSYPTNTIAIKRVEYEGRKLQPIDFRDDDAMTLVNSATVAQGSPQFYAIWNETLYLRPIPDSSSGELTIYSYNEPSTLTISSTLEIPSQWHMDIVNFVVKEMYAKDLNPTMYALYNDRWERTLVKARAWQKKKKRGDSFAAVKEEESLSGGVFGIL